LFHGSYQHFFKPFGIHFSALGVIAVEQVDCINAYFCCFLQKPFQAVVVLGRCYGNVQLERPMVVAFLAFSKLNNAIFWVWFKDVSIEDEPFSIGNKQFVAGLHAQHTYAMFAFLLSKKVVSNSTIRNISNMHGEGFVMQRNEKTLCCSGDDKYSTPLGSFGGWLR